MQIGHGVNSDHIADSPNELCYAQARGFRGSILTRLACMAEVVIEIGEKLHIVTRRNFAEDLRRHFAGTVEAVAGGLVRLHGYTFVFNPNALEYRRRPEVRTRIFNLGDAQLIVNVISSQVQVDELEYRMQDGRLVVTDGKRFKLDVNEFGASH